MNYGICNLSVIPARSKPSDKREMVTQLLFGEHFEILDSHENWCLVRLAHDDYECWIESKQFLPVSRKVFNELNKLPIVCFTELVRFIVNKKDASILPIVLGSSLPYLNGNVCNVGGNEYSFYEKQVNGGDKTIRELILENSKKYLNAPYLWGGRSPFGIDCSGFTQMVFKLCGIRLPRDTHQQAETGKTIDFVEEAKQGDLAFFASLPSPKARQEGRRDNEEKRITHVGIILGDNRIIHASGRVRIDKIDQQGIYNVDARKYSHTLRLLKRVV